jgi:hypothetical protein
MTTKQSIITLAITVFLVGVISSGLIMAQQNRGAAINGNYALSSGQFTAIGKAGTTSTLQGVFKIDTVTGRTWLYDNLQDDQGKIHTGWRLISEFQ